jgi:hypothetical protein
MRSSHLGSARLPDVFAATPGSGGVPSLGGADNAWGRLRSWLLGRLEPSFVLLVCLLVAILVLQVCQRSLLLRRLWR